jgi:Polyketide cyclase / dehydrase and lipid transport
MRFEQTFSVARPPKVVFEYVIQPGNLADWQTSKTFVEQLTDGPPRLGTRLRERTKVRGRKEWEQIVEFVEFERPRRLGVHIVEGDVPVDGRWTFERDAGATLVHFEAWGELRGPLKLLQPVVKLAMAREFATYHRNLRRNVEAL